MLHLALPNSDLIWSSPGIVGKIAKNEFMRACTYSIVNLFIHHCYSAAKADSCAALSIYIIIYRQILQLTILNHCLTTFN